MELINKNVLKEVVREVVREEMKKMENDHLKTIGLTRKEVIDEIHASIQQRVFRPTNAAKYIDRSVSKLNALVREGQLKKHVNGTLSYYLKEDLDAWADKGV